jgi:hypothetical protein
MFRLILLFDVFLRGFGTQHHRRRAIPLGLPETHPDVVGIGRAFSQAELTDEKP